MSLISFKSNSSKNNTMAILAIILASFIFGSFGVLVRLINEEISPISQALFRVIFALVILSIISLPKNNEFFKITKKDIPFYFISGFFGYGLFLVFFTLANIHTTIANAFFLLFTEPIFVIILSYFFLKEKITKEILITTILCFSGVFFIFNPTNMSDNILGNIYGLGAGFFFAVYILIGRYMGRKYKSSTNTLWSFIFGLLFLFPAAFLWENPLNLNISVYIWFLVALFGILNASGYFLLNYGLKNITANYGGLLLLLEPVVAVFFALGFFGEIPDINTIFGSLLIIGSIMYLTYVKIRQKE